MAFVEDQSDGIGPGSSQKSKNEGTCEKHTSRIRSDNVERFHKGQGRRYVYYGKCERQGPAQVQQAGSHQSVIYIYIYIYIYIFYIYYI